MRDMLLGRVPSDFDIAAGMGTRELLRTLGHSARQARNAVGTVIVQRKDHRFEVTPLRNFRADTANAADLWVANLARCAHNAVCLSCRFRTLLGLHQLRCAHAVHQSVRAVQMDCIQGDPA